MPTATLDDKARLEICRGITEMNAELQKANAAGKPIIAGTFAIMANQLRVWNAMLGEDEEVEDAASIIEKTIPFPKTLEDVLAVLSIIADRRMVAEKLNALIGAMKGDSYQARNLQADLGYQFRIAAMFALQAWLTTITTLFMQVVEPHLSALFLHPQTRPLIEKILERKGERKSA